MKRNYNKEMLILFVESVSKGLSRQDICKKLADFFLSEGSKLYEKNKNRSCRRIFCEILSVMEPEDVKFTIQWIGHKYDEQNHRYFGLEERWFIIKSIQKFLKIRKVDNFKEYDHAMMVANLYYLNDIANMNVDVKL